MTWFIRKTFQSLEILTRRTIRNGLKVKKYHTRSYTQLFHIIYIYCTVLSFTCLGWRSIPTTVEEYAEMKIK